MAIGIQSKIDELVLGYPALVKSDTVLGQTYEGRDLRVLHVGAGTNKPQIALVVGQHAAEWMAWMASLFALTSMLHKAGVSERENYLITNHEFVVFPAVNPDGYVYSQIQRDWRKNRRVFAGGTGVDPNRNWTHDWAEATNSGGTNPSDYTYKGPSALSEQETSLIDAYLRGLPRLVGAWDIHSISGDFGTYDAYLAIAGNSASRGAVPAGDAADFAAMRTAVKAAMDSNGWGNWVYDDAASFSSDAGGVLRNHIYWELGVPPLLFECTAESGFVALSGEIVPQGEDILDGMEAFCRHFNFT